MARAARPEGRADGLRRRRRERARLRRRERFLADALHQLRNAVGTLATQAAMLGRAGSPDEQRDVARALEQRLLQLGRFLHQLDRVDRRQSGSTELPVFDLVECAQAVVCEFAAAASDRGVDLGWVGDAPAQAVLARGHADEIHEALANLLENAIRHTPPGGRVDVSVEVAVGGECRLRVADQGPGVPPEQRRRLFARHAQGRSGTADARGHGGLGLDIAWRLAHANRGRIEADDGLPGAGGGTGLSMAVVLRRAPA